MRRLYEGSCASRDIGVAVAITIGQFLLLCAISAIAAAGSLVIGSALVWAVHALFFPHEPVSLKILLGYGFALMTPLLFLGGLLWIGLRDLFRENVKEACRLRREAGGRHG
ncbi:hypothetical protein [Acidithiobacillus sp.]|uniref:hypothetical protein n=1 Tax=Acidithiobacillus sp. TaxID=1872118 RepID=UPI003D0760C5